MYYLQGNSLWLHASGKSVLLKVNIIKLFPVFLFLFYVTRFFQHALNYLRVIGLVAIGADGS